MNGRRSWLRLVSWATWIRPALAGPLANDEAVLLALPRFARLGLPALAVLLVIIEFAAHLVANQAYKPFVVPLGGAVVYTESLLFMSAALALALAFPSLGILIVAVHVPLDLIAAAAQPRELTPLLTAIPGRFVADLLLWILVVDIPLVVRASAVSIATRVPRPLATGAGWATGGAMGFLLPFLWSQAAGVLIRPVFTWTALGAPTRYAVSPIQDGGIALGVVGALAALAAFAIRIRLPHAGRGARVEKSERHVAPWVGTVRYGAGVLATALLLMGLVNTTFDAVVVLATVVIVAPAARLLAGRTPVAAWLAVVPIPIRLVIGVAVGYLVASTLTPPNLSGSSLSPYWSVVVGAVIGGVVLNILLAAPHRAPSSFDHARPSPALMGVLAIAAMSVWSLVLPVPALADNCSDFKDCWNSIAAAAAAAAGIAMAVGLNALGNAINAGLGPAGSKNHAPHVDGVSLSSGGLNVAADGANVSFTFGADSPGAGPADTPGDDLAAALQGLGEAIAIAGKADGIAISSEGVDVTFGAGAAAVDGPNGGATAGAAAGDAAGSGSSTDAGQSTGAAASATGNAGNAGNSTESGNAGNAGNSTESGNAGNAGNTTESGNAGNAGNSTESGNAGNAGTGS